MDMKNLVTEINRKLDLSMTDKEIIDYMQVTLFGEEISVLPEEFHDQLVMLTISRIKGCLTPTTE